MNYLYNNELIHLKSYDLIMICGSSGIVICLEAVQGV